MLSYQHAYHAGCLADVHKHGLLSLLLQKLTEKERPVTYMETHAGRGVYDLESFESLKTGEAHEGIVALQEEGFLPKDHPYKQVLEAVQKRYGTPFYPGSPAVARELLRPQDHMHLMELHPQEIKYLKRNFRDDNCHTHHRDGYEGVLGVSPPPARAGLVLIDPSYEVKTEYEDCITFIQKLYRKWPEACVALWYPMLGSGHYKNMVRGLDRLVEETDFKNVDHRTWVFRDPKTTSGMYGTGFYILNCPWGVEEAFNNFETCLS